MTEWLSSYSVEIFSALVSFVATALFHGIWRVATMSARIRRAEKDIDALAEKLKTERAMARRARGQKPHLE